MQVVERGAICKLSIFVCKWEKVQINYIDKAIVEEQAKERSTHAGLLRYGRLHCGFHRGEEVWT